MATIITSEETYLLIQKLARRTGESQAEALAVAVRERLERIPDGQEKMLRDRLIEISKDSGPRFVEPYKSMDHGVLLYDDDGLPK